MAKDKKDLSRQIMLPPVNLKQAETVVTVYHAVIPTGHVRSDLEGREYWCHVARKLRQHTRIDFVAEDFSFEGSAIVKSCGDTWASIWITRWNDGERGGVEDERLDHFKIDNTATGFRVIHKATGDVLAKGLGTRTDAMSFIDDYLKKAA
jgi:hypothetical protein